MKALKLVTAAAVILIGGAAVMTPATSHAQQSMPAAAAGDSGLPAFEDLDKNHHGYLSRSDIPKDVDGLKPLRMHFAEADANSNGRLEKDEYQAYVARFEQGHAASSGSGQPAAQPMH